MAGSDIGPDGPCAQCACGADVFRRGARGPIPTRCLPCAARLNPRRYLGPAQPRKTHLRECVACGKQELLLRSTKSVHCRRCAPRPADYAHKNAQRRLAKAREAGVKPFEQFQRERTAASVKGRSAVCGWCGVGFVARGLDRLSYCSRQCGGKAVGAEKSRRAAESAQPFTPVRFGQCAECDKPIVARMGRTVCSSECATKRAKRSEAAKVERARAAFRPRLFACAECSKSCATEYGKPRTRFCSDECGRRATKRTSRKRERARLRLAKVEAVDPLKVFERDGWRCQMCRVATPRRYKGTTHQRAPELDHITALAKGGDHSYRNTQLLCRACNGAKSDRDVGQQMRLFG